MASNEFMVGVYQDKVLIGRSLGGDLRQHLTSEQALNLAAWLVAAVGCIASERARAAKARFEELYREALES